MQIPQTDTHPTHCLLLRKLSYYYGDFHFLVRNILQSDSKVPTFQRNSLLLAYSALKMGAACTPKSLVPLHQTTKGHMPQH